MIFQEAFFKILFYCKIEKKRPNIGYLLIQVGVLSLGYPLVSFQEKSESAHETLLSLVNEELDRQSEPTMKEIKNKQNEEHKNLSFQVGNLGPRI